MAGRCISVTHEALGAVRVMRTCGAEGEIVGMAASVCKEFDADPRGVYEKHLADLQKRMRKGVGKVGRFHDSLLQLGRARTQPAPGRPRPAEVARARSGRTLHAWPR